MNLKRLLAALALIGAGAAGAHAMGYPLDPRDWPLGESVCSSANGEFEIRDRTILSRINPVREADWVRFDANGRSMRVAGRSSVVDVPIGQMQSIDIWDSGVEILLDGGLTEKTDFLFRRPASDCQNLYHAYRARHAHLIMKGG